MVKNCFAPGNGGGSGGGGGGGGGVGMAGGRGVCPPFLYGSEFAKFLRTPFLQNSSSGCF